MFSESLLAISRQRQCIGKETKLSLPQIFHSKRRLTYCTGYSQNGYLMRIAFFLVKSTYAFLGRSSAVPCTKLLGCKNTQMLSKHWRCSLWMISKWWLRGNRTWTFTALIFPYGIARRNATYKSILLSATTSSLAEKTPGKYDKTINLHDTAPFPRFFEIGFYSRPQSTPWIWYASLFAKPHGWYQLFRGNSKIRYKVSK